MGKQAIVADITGRDDLHQVSVAKQVADTLTDHYPNHLWAVGWQGGAVVVKNLAISDTYGMVLHPHRYATASEMTKDAIMKGGELLERAHMKRGKWDGRAARILEGSSPRFFNRTFGE